MVDIAIAALSEPKGIVEDVIHPVVGAVKLQAVVNEYEAKGSLDQRIQKVMRGSYANHYRHMNNNDSQTKNVLAELGLNSQ